VKVKKILVRINMINSMQYFTKKAKNNIHPNILVDTWTKLVESCKILSLREHFLFTCSDTGGAGCII